MVSGSEGCAEARNGGCWGQRGVPVSPTAPSVAGGVAGGLTRCDTHFPTCCSLADPVGGHHVPHIEQLAMQH